MIDKSSGLEDEEEKQIQDFFLNYSSSSVLNLYTQSTFFHLLLNRILRQQRHDLIDRFRHVIFDLIKKLPPTLLSEEDKVLLTLYRGQQMTLSEIDKLNKKVGEIVYSRSFLSTSFQRSIANIFAGDGSNSNPYSVSVILEIQVDTGQSIGHYALINNSAEEEVLFAPNIKFVLMSCRKLNDNGRLWHLKLIAISDKQEQQMKQNYGETFSLSGEANYGVIGRGCSLQIHLMRPLSKVETGIGKYLLLTFPRYFCVKKFVF